MFCRKTQTSSSRTFSLTSTSFGWASLWLLAGWLTEYSAMSTLFWLGIARFLCRSKFTPRFATTRFSRGWAGSLSLRERCRAQLDQPWISRDELVQEFRREKWQKTGMSWNLSIKLARKLFQLKCDELRGFLVRESIVRLRNCEHPADKLKSAKKPPRTKTAAQFLEVNVLDTQWTSKTLELFIWNEKKICP